MEEFDINKVAAEFLSSQIGEIGETGKFFLKESVANIKLSLKIVYTNYLKRVYERYGKSKSFFIRDTPVHLHEFYVPMGVKCNDIIINSANIKAILDVNPFSIISGTGGAGKTIMLKHLFIDSLKNKKQIPIFTELRDLNNIDLPLIDLLKLTTLNFGLEIEIAHFLKALEKGHFILFLDGLDEVNKKRKVDLLREINELTIKYPKISIILSTRPDIKISELDVFSTFKCLPLSLEQSINLINKLPAADDELKEKFKKDLGQGLYEKHKSMLSNPLLLSMMMLTYGFSADIPSKSSIFYAQAFDALFQRHDSFKGAYKRQRETSLDIQEFSKVFSTFCVLTYEDRKLKFSKIEILEYLNKAKKISGLNFELDDFYTDLLQAVSLLVEDGMSIYFTHRSFQEFFASKFIIGQDKERKKLLFDKYQKYAYSDKVFELSREIDQDFMDFEIIQPFIDGLFDEIGVKKNIGNNSYLKYIKLMWSRFEFKGGNLYGSVNDAKINQMVYFVLFDICPSYEIDAYKLKDNSELFQKLKNKSLEGQITNIEAKSIKVNDDFFKSLEEDGILFSKRPLKALKKANDEILKRKNELEKSLDEILFNNESS